MSLFFLAKNFSSKKLTYDMREHVYGLLCMINRRHFKGEKFFYSRSNITACALQRPDTEPGK